MADRVQAYNRSPVPRATLQGESNRERHLIDHRLPHRAATSPFPSTMSSQVNPYLGQTAYPPPPLYSGQRNPQTTPMPNTYFPQNKKYTYNDSFYPTDEPIPGPSQLYPAHEQQFYSVSYYGHREVQMPTPEPFVPVPPKPLALQVTRQNGGHALLQPTLSRSLTSPPVPPKPVLLSKSEPRPVVIPTGAYPGSSWPGIMTSTADEIPRPPGAVATDPPVAEESANQQLREEEDGGDDLAVAMALSKDESEREEERMQELVRLEEEELERALAASMLTTNGNYDDFESQLHADPPDLVSSATGSNFSAIPPDVHLEAGPSVTSSLSLEAPAKDASSGPQETDELDHEDGAFQVHEGTKPTPETVKTSPHQTTKRCSLDAPSCSRMSSDDDQVEIYPPAAVGSTSAAPSFPPTIQPRTVIGTNDGDDSDDDGLPYLKGARESRSVSIPLPERESRLSPVSASFIDLSYDDSYIDEDEVFARRLQEEEKSSGRLSEGETAVPRQSEHLDGQEPLECNLSRNSSATSASTRPHTETPNNLPIYNNAMSHNPGPALRGSSFLPLVTVDSPTSPEKAELVQNSSTAGNPIARASSQLAVSFPSNSLSAVALPPDGPQRARGSSLSALIPGRTPTENELPLSPVDDLATPTNHLSLDLRAGYPPTTSMKGISNSSNNPTCAGVFNPNLFIDTELFLGVSIQFTPPVISARLEPMQGQMPTLIHLPYGRCPPLHFQAPSWRRMLKLMARSSSTKMEPSIEAMAVNKNELLKLRTVIQFIKPHHMSNEWRTILWFTIDHAVPPNMPNAAKHSSTNVNNLPFSYTLSSIPALLKDASDTSLSKTYTIPATGAVPYPSLPITFPNLALYLQAALDESRKQSESSPLRKLAKMVQTCYLSDFVPQESDEPENSRGVSGLFKRVIGRGGKKKGGGGNEDTYDLVTPFVPDEWG